MKVKIKNLKNQKAFKKNQTNKKSQIENDKNEMRLDSIETSEERLELDGDDLYQNRKDLKYVEKFYGKIGLELAKISNLIEETAFNRINQMQLQKIPVILEKNSEDLSVRGDYDEGT